MIKSHIKFDRESFQLTCLNLTNNSLTCYLRKSHAYIFAPRFVYGPLFILIIDINISSQPFHPYEESKHTLSLSLIVTSLQDPYKFYKPSSSSIISLDISRQAQKIQTEAHSICAKQRSFFSWRANILFFDSFFHHRFPRYIILTWYQWSPLDLWHYSRLYRIDG